jgi:uncharacterized glyoxalase superfamily protein PhnB
MAQDAPADSAREGFVPRLTAGDTERLFGTLAEGGSMKMPPWKTFWALRYGGVVDRLGNSLGDQL